MTAAERYRILLVEDDAGDALLVEEYLADAGLPHSLHWVPSLARALEVLAAEPADCVLVDLHLPDANGLAALTEVRRACPTAAAIVLTGLVDAGAGERAVAAGAQDYLIKGQVDGSLLRRALRYAVGRKQAELAEAELREKLIRSQENARLERGLLPAPLLRTGTVTVTTRYLPGRQDALLGGDFLDVIETADGSVHAIIGDVSGHGPDEAALGVCLRIAWRALLLAGHQGADLLDLLEQVLITERPGPHTFVTAATVTVSPARDLATIHLAGHHEPLLSTPAGRAAVKAVQEVPASHGIALGLAPGMRYWPQTTLPLPPVGALLLYTDGLIEGRAGANGARLGSEGLLELIGAAGPAEPADFLDQLIDTVQGLNAGRHEDDLAVLHLAWQRQPQGRGSVPVIAPQRPAHS